MSDRKPLMQKATAVWLVDNTSLTFEQIAEFCGMHYLEVKGIADGDVAQGVLGKNPVSAGELTREEIAKGEEDADYRLHLAESKVKIPEIKVKKRPRYTPVSRRQDRPNAVLWLLRNHAELKDSQIMRLVGTTKPTILQIRERTHWNAANLQPQDPVTLGLCSQTDLDTEVQKAARRVEREREARGEAPAPAGTLLPTSETTSYASPEATPDDDHASGRGGRAPSAAEVFARVAPAAGQGAKPEDAEEADEAARVLAKLQGMSGGEAEDEDEDAATEAASDSDGDTASAPATSDAEDGGDGDAAQKS